MKKLYMIENKYLWELCSWLTLKWETLYLYLTFYTTQMALVLLWEEWFIISNVVPGLFSLTNDFNKEKNNNNFLLL